MPSIIPVVDIITAGWFILAGLAKISMDFSTLVKVNLRLSAAACLPAFGVR